MTTTLATTLDAHRQNAHLTFKRNLHMGRHGWLRLTPAYSAPLVRGILDARRHTATVLDPFSGTGTTALCAAYAGILGTGLEINPFLVWLSSVKFRNFSPAAIEKTRSLGAVIAVATTANSALSVDPPPIHNIQRWWNEGELNFLCRLKKSILNASNEGSDERDLLLVAFCRVVIALSNAAFNHQSISFKATDNEPHLFSLERDNADIFRKELDLVLDGAADNPGIVPSIVTGDAREPSRFLNDKFDMIITSPPYPNRISYIRELRPYMYWLGFLTNGRDAGEYDWQTIGGTWGVATSRLVEWAPSGTAFTPPTLKKALYGIADPKNENGSLLANYVAKYFEDMWQHISDIDKVLNDGAEVHYIVGNSTFYRVLLPVEAIFKTMLQEVGFHDVKITKIRKRNSKAELYEFDITGRRKPSVKHGRAPELRRTLPR